MSCLDMIVNIYQDVYDSVSGRMVSEDAIPLRRTGNVEGLKEFQAFQLLLDSGAASCSDYLGLFSVKFPNKMRIAVREARSFVEENPGYDVYLFNPYPYESYLFFNQWDSGEFHHPGIRDLAGSLFEELSLGDIERAPRMGVAQNVFCNYWIGSSSFFRYYVSLMNSMAEVMFSQRERFLEKTWHLDEVGTPFFTFILERMLAALLIREAERFRVLSYPVPVELYGAMIADDSPIRFEKKRLHFLAVRDRIEALDQEFVGIGYSESYRSRFIEINNSASPLISEGIPQLYRTRHSR